MKASEINQPIKPDPKYDGTEYQIRAENELTINGHLIQDWGSYTTIDGRRSKFGYMETVRMLSQMLARRGKQ